MAICAAGQMWIDECGVQRTVCADLSGSDSAKSASVAVSEAGVQSGRKREGSKRAARPTNLVSSSGRRDSAVATPKRSSPSTAASSVGINRNLFLRQGAKQSGGKQRRILVIVLPVVAEAQLHRLNALLKFRKGLVDLAYLLVAEREFRHGHSS